jgi:hypothetical protein
MSINNKNFEIYLNNNPDKLSFMNNYLREYQFSEEFLIKNRMYYDSWKCLRTQNNLSAYFCFCYLYDTPEYDSADNWTDYNEIKKYLKQRNYIDDDIKNAFDEAMKFRELN